MRASFIEIFDHEDIEEIGNADVIIKRIKDSFLVFDQYGNKDIFSTLEIERFVTFWKKADQSWAEVGPKACRERISKMMQAVLHKVLKGEKLRAHSPIWLFCVVSGTGFL